MVRVFKVLYCCEINSKCIWELSTLHTYLNQVTNLNMQQITCPPSFQSLCINRYVSTLLLMCEYFWWMLFNTRTYLVAFKDKTTRLTWKKAVLRIYFKSTLKFEGSKYHFHFIISSQMMFKICKYIVIFTKKIENTFALFYFFRMIQPSSTHRI